MKMKISSYIAAVAIVSLLAACVKKDNFDPPSSILSGRIVQLGTTTPLAVRANLDAQNMLELRQRGFPLFTPIGVYVKQDGSFSASLYDGNYKLTRASRGPWVANTDTINVTVKGATTVDVPVVPHQTVSGFTVAVSGTKPAYVFTASFTLKQVSTVVVDQARFFIGKTNIVDVTNSFVNASKTAAVLGAFTNGSLSTTIAVNMPTPTSTPAFYYNKNYVYGRVGVKAKDIGEYTYSDVLKITLP
jgi:hypothetical protein